MYFYFFKIRSITLQKTTKGMSDLKKISSALISVFHKDGLAPIVQKLNDLGVTIYSTGGTPKIYK